jgi:hypothetical protein
MNTIPDSRFTESMVRENGLAQRGFQAWVFLPAMLFKAEEKWWGDSGKRSSPHEGIDVCLFSDASHNLFRLSEGTKIPAMYDGTIAAIIDDFLGASIIVEHKLPSHRSPLLSIYGHVTARETLRVGSAISETEIIGTLADSSKATVHIYPHLHVSIAWPSKSTSCDNLTWRDLGNPQLFTMTDPLDVIGGPYQVIERVEESPEQA